MNKLDSTQLEQLKAIGAYLYEVRLSQSRTLEEIAAKTYIPLRLLKALEAGQEHPLPEPVFVQGFIRRYADALGLDGLELAQEFPVQPAIATELKTEYFDNSLAELGPTSASEVAIPKGFSMRRTQRSPLSWLASGAVALFILGGLVYLLGRMIGSRPATVAEQSDSASTVVSPSTAPSSAPASSPAASAATPSPVAASIAPAAPSVSAAATPSPLSPSPSPASNAPVNVNVSLTADSWLEVTVDGEVQVSETLPRGTKRSWSGEQAVTIVAGNAGAVQVVFNQAKAQTMGDLGTVAERTFTANRE